MAETIEIFPDTSDTAAVYGWWKLHAGAADDRSPTQDSIAGHHKGTTTSAATVYALPDLTGKTTIESADLMIEMRAEKLDDTNDPPTATGAVFVRTSTGAPTSSDFIAPTDFDGTNTPAGWTLLQLDLFTPGMASGTDVSLSTAGQDALKSFLQGYYTGTPAGGDYLIANFAMDLNSDTLDTGADVQDKYNVNVTNDRDGETFFPLTINAVPEPATMALMGLGGLAFLRRRRA
jgi:hypothetical protein